MKWSSSFCQKMAKDIIYELESTQETREKDKTSTSYIIKTNSKYKKYTK